MATRRTTSSAGRHVVEMRSRGGAKFYVTDRLDAEFLKEADKFQVAAERIAGRELRRADRIDKQK